MVEMDEKTKFNEEVLKIVQMYLKFLSSKLGLDIKLTDLSIDKYSIEIIGDKIIDDLNTISSHDFKDTLEIYVEPTIEVYGKKVTAPIILKVPKEGNIEVIDIMLDTTTLTPDEAKKFEEQGERISRILEAVLASIIVRAILLGLELAIKILK